VQQQTPQPMKAPTRSAGGSDRAAADAAADESADTDSAGGSDRAAAPQPMKAPTRSAGVPTVQQQTPQPMKAPT
jgi:hypothetical protein